MATVEIAKEGIDLLNQAGLGRPADAPHDKEWLGEMAVVRVLDAGSQSAAFLLAERRPVADVEVNLGWLLDQLTGTFDENELQELAFRLGVEYQDLPGDNRSARARAFIAYLQRRGRLVEFITFCEQQRPHIRWQSKAGPASPLSHISKTDVGLILDFTRPALLEAARFLDKKGIDANLVLITNKLPYPNAGLLPVTERWDEVARNFTAATTRLGQMNSNVSVHFFVSAPGALAFGLGSLWGTVKKAAVYHYEDGDYHLVMETDRHLK